MKSRGAEKGFRLPAVTDGSPAEEVLAGVLAVERHGGGPVTLDLRGESGNVEAVLRQFLIASPFRLAQVGKAETVIEHLRVFGRLQQAGRQSDKVQRRPEPVAGSGVIGAAPPWTPGLERCRREQGRDRERGHLEGSWRGRIMERWESRMGDRRFPRPSSGCPSVWCEKTARSSPVGTCMNFRMESRANR